MSNIACDSEGSALKVVLNDVFDTVVDKLSHSVDFEIKKEAMMVVGNVLTCMPMQHVREVLDKYDQMLHHYFQGLTMISNNGLINAILESVDSLLHIDQVLHLQGTDSMQYRIELAHGLDHIEEL